MMPLMSQHSQHPTSQARTRPQQTLPTPRQCCPVSPGPEWETGSGENQKCFHLHPSLNSHRRDNLASTGAVVAVMVLSLVMPASQDGGRHSTQRAKKGCYAQCPLAKKGCYVGRWPAPTMPRCPPNRSDHSTQEAKEDAIETVSPSHPKRQPRGCPSRYPEDQPDVIPDGGHQSTQRINQ